MSKLGTPLATQEPAPDTVTHKTISRLLTYHSTVIAASSTGHRMELLDGDRNIIFHDRVVGDDATFATPSFVMNTPWLPGRALTDAVQDAYREQGHT